MQLFTKKEYIPEHHLNTFGKKNRFRMKVMTALQPFTVLIFPITVGPT
jgi:hypothetical protein